MFKEKHFTDNCEAYPIKFVCQIGGFSILISKLVTYASALRISAIHKLDKYIVLYCPK